MEHFQVRKVLWCCIAENNVEFSYLDCLEEKSVANGLIIANGY